ncbi:uncharacterized protein LOC144619427 [Crassostrea virginica]
MTAITSAKLSFINGSHREPEKVPATVEEVLDLALKTPASECTANAASLYPYYERKEVLKTLIMPLMKRRLLISKISDLKSCTRNTVRRYTRPSWCLCPSSIASMPRVRWFLSSRQKALTSCSLYSTARSLISPS